MKLTTITHVSVDGVMQGLGGPHEDRRRGFVRGLVDEMILLTYPVVVGQGERLFPASGPDCALRLIDHRATAGGVVVQTYQPSGRPQYAAD